MKNKLSKSSSQSISAPAAKPEWSNKKPEGGPEDYTKMTIKSPPSIDLESVMRKQEVETSAPPQVLTSN